MQQHFPVRIIDPSRRQRDGGYVLLAILLMMALMIIAATVEAPRIVQQMKRDREEEMIHRGTEYARAIKKFYKKFGRYPTTLEQLDNTNQIRFLRKRYKDPLTNDGKWTLLHYGDIQGLLNRSAPGTPAAVLGQQGQGASPGFAAGSNSLGSGSTFGGSATQPAAYTNGPNSGGSSSAGSPAQNVTYPNGPGSDGSGGGFGGGPAGSTGGSTQAGNSLGISPFANSVNGQTGPPGQTGSSVFGQSGAGGNQTFGGGAIVGVASLSKDPTIRLYNKKQKYYEWQFIYDPTSDRPNVLLRGPYQPVTLGGAQVGTPAGQMNVQPQTTVGQQPGNIPQQTGPGQPPPGNQFPPDQNQPPQ